MFMSEKLKIMSFKISQFKIFVLWLKNDEPVFK